MPALPVLLGAVVFLLTSIAGRDARPEDSLASDDAAASPRAVVDRWLELHRTGRRDEAAALTTASDEHRAQHRLPSKRDTGVRVKRSLGNRRAAAVVTTPLDGGADAEKVLLFWLVRRDGGWRINKSDAAEKGVVKERLRGFLEAGDVSWHLERSQLLGRWEAGAGTPPGGRRIACGSRLELGDDNRYRLAAWGPFGPDPDHDVVMQGKWRIADGRILLSHQDRTLACRIAWMADALLVIVPPDGKGRAEYERTAAATKVD